ncbi:kinase-like domain-containing protein [Obelidium mucronatum]|nr:kinase-like domain-containing protein [Obelidium mucronatum]
MGFVFDVSKQESLRTLYSTSKRAREDVVWVSCRSYDLSVCKLDFEECEFEEKTRNISIDPKSLAKGSARVAHPCQVQGRAIDLVAKIYKDHGQNTKYVHQSDAQCLWVANQSWVAFLEHARTCADQGQSGAGDILEAMDGVSFVDGSVYELEGSYSFPVVFVEPCIPGTFTKYQSNAKFGQQTTAAQIMDCFSHYSWTHSDKKYMVADLQGNLNAKMLTDPQIHCEEFDFSLGNLGADGIKDFFKQHKCGSYCDALDIQNNRPEDDDEDEEK